MDKIHVLIKSTPFVIAIIYSVIGILWILYSDYLVLKFFNEPEAITLAQSLKGFGFVGMSSLLVFTLIWKTNDLLGKAIEALKRNVGKFQATFEQAPVGIVYHHPNENWLEVNQTLCDLLGYNKAELMHLGFKDIIHPDDLNKGRDLDRQLVEGVTNSFSAEKRYIRKDGSTIRGMLRKSAVKNGQGEIEYFVGIIEDISQLKKTELELRNSLNTFRKFVPEQFLNYLGHKNIWDVGRGDQIEKTFTVMFTDIRSYTSLSEKYTDSENFDFISSFIYKLSPAITKNGGFIDKFIGDAIMALFPDESDHAIKSALAIQEAVKSFNKTLLKKGKDPIRVGIGINTGSLILGTLGDDERLQTTVLSDHVNIASRIEDMTKVYKAPILLSENTYVNLRCKEKYNLRMIEKVNLEGRAGNTNLYELLSH